MTLDPLLFDTYRQYKAGTHKVMTWLASRVKETTVLSELFPTTSEAKGKGRLKGKARTAAKRTPQKHLIPLSFITRIAKAIASITKVKVPETIIRTLEEVVAARSACNDYFKQQGSAGTSTQESNQKHQYFVKVLRETLKILKPLSHASDKTDETKANTANDEADNDFATLRNRFEYLEIEEPTESASSTLPSKSNKAANKIEVELELEPTDEDISFAIFCFLKDLTEIRHYVRQTWAEYREHQITFTTASLTMNTAISIFRDLNDKFLSEFPQFKDHGKIIEYLYNGYCDPNSQDKQDFATYNGPNFKISSKIFFCDNTYGHLRWFFMGGEQPFYQDGHRLELHLTQDEETLLKCLSLLGLLASESEGDFFNDQLIQGLHTLKVENPEKHIYTWVVFAVQLFVDTRRVVGTELQRCFHEAHELQRWMSTTLSQSQLFGRTNKMNDFYEVNANKLNQVKGLLEATLKEDTVRTMLNDTFGNDYATRHSWGPFYLFRNHPMLLGLIIQHFLAELPMLGILLTGDQAAVITSMHLYNAAQQFGAMPTSLEWNDMERVIDWQGSSWVFCGDRPKNPQESFRHYNIIMGVSATVLSRDRHGNSTARPRITTRSIIPPMSQKKNRKLRFMSTDVELMYETARAPESSIGIGWKSTRAATEPLVMLEMLVKKHLKSNAEITQKKSAIRPKVPPLSMISIFKDHMKSEEKVLRFDLFAFNQRCVELLRRVQRVCIEQSPLDYPPEQYGTERWMTGCFPHMIAGVIGLERFQPTRFTEACDLVKNLITTKGDNEYEKAKSRCFIKGDGSKKVTDSFSTPVEDTISLPYRSMFSRIIIADGPPESGGFTII